MYFIANFDPFRRDIIYGTSGSRANYLEKFMESYQRRWLERVKYSGHEHFSVYGTKGFYINDYNEPIAKADFRSANKLHLRAKHRAQEDYLGKLHNTHLSPHSVAKASWKKLAKGNDQITTNFKQTSEEDLASARMALAIRRACKFGIDYVLKNLNGAKVHYILDAIVMNDVVGKTQMLLWTAKVGVPITTSELRFLFRNWNRFRSNKNFCFYLNYRQVRAPWETSPQIWVNYAIHRVHKFRERYENQADYPLKQFDNAIAQNRPDSAMRWFHSLPIIK